MNMLPKPQKNLTELADEELLNRRSALETRESQWKSVGASASIVGGFLFGLGSVALGVGSLPVMVAAYTGIKFAAIVGGYALAASAGGVAGLAFAESRARGAKREINDIRAESRRRGLPDEAEGAVVVGVPMPDTQAVRVLLDKIAKGADDAVEHKHHSLDPTLAPKGPHKTLTPK
jgi:hypothetical protein